MAVTISGAGYPSGDYYFNQTTGQWESSQGSGGAKNVQLTGSILKSDGATSPVIQKMQFNGNTYDLERNNVEGILFASAARTATTTAPTVYNYNAKGIFVRLSITAVPVAPGTGGLSVEIQSGDGSVILLNDTTKITTTGTYGFMIYPGIGAGVGGSATLTMLQTANYAIPRRLFVSVIANDSQSYTYDASYTLIL